MTLNIFNAPGGEMETLVNENLSQGDHVFELSALNFENGVYFYRLHFGSIFSDKKAPVFEIAALRESRS